MNPQNPNQRIQLIIQSPIHPHSQTLTLTLTAANQTPLSNLKHHLTPPPPPSLYYFSFNGKLLNDTSTVGSLVTSTTARLLTLTVHPKLLGGGGDGGATGAESRDCYLKMYAEKKPDKVDPNEKRLSRWTTCALSFEPLSPPCVVDRLGNVFNKESLVKSLISKSLPKEFGHIRGLKDMFDVDLKTEFYCPISGFEFNGKYKFFALVSCGHVFSAKALKEVKSSSCLVCHEEFKECDKIVINPSDDEVVELKKKLVEERATKVSKKAKVKKGKRNVVDVNDGGKASVKNVDDGLGVAKGGLGGGGGENDVGRSTKRFKAVDIAPPNANKEVYASIFTSSRKSEFKETYSCRSLPLGRN